MKYLTLERLMSWYPCYTEAKILKMSGGRTKIKIDNIFDLNIDDADKIWILLHGSVFTSRELRLMACEFAGGATKSTAWRAAWDAAWDAGEAAWDAGDAAWDAGEAAMDAAGTAAWNAMNAAGEAARRAAWKEQLKIVKKYWEAKR